MATKFVFNALTGNFDLVTIPNSSTNYTIIGVSTTSPFTLAALPNGAIVDKIKVIIDTPFDGIGATLAVGNVGTPDTYMSITQNDLYADAKSVFEADNGNSIIIGAENVIGTLAVGTATIGSARVFIYYSVPNLI